MAKEEALHFLALCCFKAVACKCICLRWCSCLSANGRESTTRGPAVNICKMASLASCVSLPRHLLCLRVYKKALWRIGVLEDCISPADSLLHCAPPCCWGRAATCERREGGRESSMAVSSGPGSASGLGRGSVGRWRVAVRGCTTWQAGGHRCLSLSLCLVSVALRFACLLEPFWGRLSTAPSTHSRASYGYRRACENGVVCWTPEGTEAREATRHF